MFPAVWDTENTCAVIDYGQGRNIRIFCMLDMKLGLLCRLVYIGLQIMHMGYLLIFIALLEHRKMDVYIGFMMLVCSCISFSRQIIYFFSFEDFIAAMNSFLVLDQNIRKHFIRTDYIACYCSINSTKAYILNQSYRISMLSLFFCRSFPNNSKTFRK